MAPLLGLATSSLTEIKKPPLKGCDMHIIVLGDLSLSEPSLEVSIYCSLTNISACNTHMLMVAKYYSISILKRSRRGPDYWIWNTVRKLFTLRRRRLGIIQDFYVLPEYRSKGIGSELLQEIIKYAATRQWKRLELCTPPLPEFERTFHFYQTNGLERTGGYKMKITITP